jgi:hypothetical protein
VFYNLKPLCLVYSCRGTRGTHFWLAHSLTHSVALPPSDSIDLFIYRHPFSSVCWLLPLYFTFIFRTSFPASSSLLGLGLPVLLLPFCFFPNIRLATLPWFIRTTCLMQSKKFFPYLIHYPNLYTFSAIPDYFLFSRSLALQFINISSLIILYLFIYFILFYFPSYVSGTLCSILSGILSDVISIRE